MARQLRLGLRGPQSFSREDYVVGPSNAQAAAALDEWPRWFNGCLVLVGPEGVGKTHLAQAWAQAAGAVILDRLEPDLAAAQGRPVLVEDVDRGIGDEALFHLINLAGREGGGLLLTARSAPAAWPATLPDLRSRLNALPVGMMEEPCDPVLEGLLRRFFRERSIRPAEDIYPYLLCRIERSAREAREIVRRLDEADDHLRPVSRVLARRLLDGEDAKNRDVSE